MSLLSTHVLVPLYCIELGCTATLSGKQVFLLSKGTLAHMHAHVLSLFPYPPTFLQPVISPLFIWLVKI